MKYAVISAQGKQYQVAEGQELVLDRIDAEAGKDYTFSDVLLLVDGDTRKVGTPTVEKAQVKAEVLEHLKGDKIRVATYKAKSRYRKVRGHRQYQTKLKITQIK